MTIEQIAAAVPAYLGFYDGKSQDTRDLKNYALGFFVDFMSAEYPGKELTPEMALEYRRSMYGLEPNTITQYMRQIRSAISFMLAARMVTGENPVPALFVGTAKAGGSVSFLCESPLPEDVKPPPGPGRCRRQTLRM